MSDTTEHFYGSPGAEKWQNVVSLFAAHNLSPDFEFE